MPTPKDPTVMRDLVTLIEACAQAEQDGATVQQFIVLANSLPALRNVPRGLYRELIETSDYPTPDNFAWLLRSIKFYCNEAEDFDPLDGLRGLETVRPKPRGGAF